MSFHQDVTEIISKEQIAKRIKELGEQITRDYLGSDLVVISVLKGSYIFCADLVRAIDLPLTVDFLGLSSYEGTESTGVVRITSDLSKPIKGKDVLVVEDIVDSGLTVAFLLENLKTRGPAGLKVCALLEKPRRAVTRVEVHYRGFSVPDSFVVGYGLDSGELFRNVPYIGVLGTK